MGPDFSPTPTNEIRETIGIDGLRLLMAEFGGRRLYIPVSIARAGLIIRKLGEPIARRMVQQFGGCRLAIPRGPSEHNAVGKAIPVQMVTHLTAQGMSAADIAVELGCTERIVHKKRADARKPYCLATVQPQQHPRRRA